MDRRAKVEQFEQIRREYEFGVGTVQGVARKVWRPSSPGASGAGKRYSPGSQTRRLGVSYSGSGQTIHRSGFGCR